MPHQCTSCERVFADGSKEMLSGCPDCGGNKFQFKPSSATSGSDDPDRPGRDGRAHGPDPGVHTDPRARTDRETRPSPSSSSDDASSRPSSSPTDQSNRSTDGPRTAPAQSISDDGHPSAGSAPTRGSAETDDSTDTDATVERGTDDTDADERLPAEDYAQASARTDMVSPDELADAATPPSGPPTDEVDGRVIEPQSDDRPGLDELREELNSQFESIKIVSPGQYELNLMELYDRQEYIISLQEDGRYVIEVPDSWGDRDDN
jgi:hypothetical protein